MLKHALVGIDIKSHDEILWTRVYENDYKPLAV